MLFSIKYEVALFINRMGGKLGSVQMGKYFILIIVSCYVATVATTVVLHTVDSPMLITVYFILV